jgi:predicted regulator of Ras-like GTPase activity (Roadblock/LC7/MglB family)
MDDFAGGELDQVMIKGKGGYMLTMHGQDLALTVLVKPDAQAAQIFSQMERAVQSLGKMGVDLTGSY